MEEREPTPEQIDRLLFDILTSDIEPIEPPVELKDKILKRIAEEPRQTATDDIGTTPDIQGSNS